MASGWGRRWGSVPWGSASGASGEQFTDVVAETVTLSEGLTASVPFDVVAAIPITPFFVRVDFSGFPDTGLPATSDPSSYSIPGLAVSSVFFLNGFPKSVFLVTDEQQTLSYTLTVSSSVLSSGGDPLGVDSVNFLGASLAPNFFASPQSNTKVMLTFIPTMLVDAKLVAPSNYTVTKVDGTTLTVTAVNVVGTEDRHVELILGDSLETGHVYSVRIDSAVQTAGNQPIFPDVDLFHWIRRDSPMRINIANFSGEVSSGLLGTPAGQVFFSPALEAAAANSVIQVDNISLCTRAFDVYEFPSLPDPPTLFTWPPPSSAYADSLLNGDGRLAATAERLGQARIVVHDLREDTLAAPVDGPCDATLVETIDITRGGFLNDARWETFPAATAGIGAFTTADNLTPIGPGPTTNINLQP